ncbi:MAG: cation-translocating P-type ATPase [Butyribacter sp.]|nr:cation-translocating P-type ATPase [bacterium]MDY3854767.1 cation-translocating P-type ATPase [Butyribacter sp.]
MKAYWNESKEELMKQFTTGSSGLTEKQAEMNRERYGKNVLQENRKERIFRIFLKQFRDLLVVILIVSAVISMFSGNMESALVILLVLVMNAVLGTAEHIKAQKSLDSLKQLSSPSAKVFRNGIKKEVPSEAIVPGDLVLLEAGDMIVADGRILHNYSLQVNESSLTGESVNVEKADDVLPEKTALADRNNMVFSGSLVTYGRAEVLITATGMDTELGKIAGLLNKAKERKTPLQANLDKFSSRLALLVMAICGIVFALCLYRKMPLPDAFMFAVALAVAAIPEALSSIVTIVQAMGMQKMAKENAIIKELKAVESLGCVSVICSDKTGTLTQNKMTAEQVYVDGKIVTPEEMDLSVLLHRYLLYDAILTNDASITDGQGIGDPTEYALLEMFRRIPVKNNAFWTENGQIEEVLRQLLKRKEEVPFDSERKLMSTKYSLHGIDTVLTKGATDVLLERCTKVRYRNDICPMTEAEKEKIKKQNQKFSENGLRVLAFAYKETEETLTADSEYDFIFLGLIAMADPPRPESVKAVEDAKRAGIRPVMITGDHKITAVAIAKKIGIYQEGNRAVTGAELDNMSEEELSEEIEKIAVYARVSPENKIRIVEAWQKKGQIVAMTGDGVNDAPALKKADIGVAMGMTGTEVSKDAADMILSDDNFATIIKAVANGRNVFRNIKNAILFLLSGNMAGILSVLYTSVAGLPVPFAPVHLLFINLLTDSLPAIAIGMEPSDAGLLQEKPRSQKDSILSKDVLCKIAGYGVLIATATLAAYFMGLRESARLASAMAFATLTLARLFHGFNCRHSKSVFQLGLLSNRYSVLAFFAGTVLLATVLCVPFLEHIFQIVPLSWNHIAWIAFWGMLPTVIIQGIKVCRELWCKWKK